MEHFLLKGGDGVALGHPVGLLEAVGDVHLPLLLVGIIDDLLYQDRLIKKDGCIGHDDQNDCDQKHTEDFLPYAASQIVSLHPHGCLLCSKCIKSSPRIPRERLTIATLRIIPVLSFLQLRGRDSSTSHSCSTAALIEGSVSPASYSSRKAKMVSQYGIRTSESVI